MTRSLWAVVAVVALALAGCADEPEDDEGNGDGTQTGDQRPPMTWNITMQGNEFVNGTITIQPGDTVRWVHEDGQTPHTVTADDESFDSGPCLLGGGVGVDCLTQGETFEHTFDTEGTFDYHCEVHAAMTGTITVATVSDTA